MCQCYVNGKCKAVLWLVVFAFFINDVSAAPQHDRMRKNNRENVDAQESSERRPKQNFPFVNNPGQQIFDRIRSNLQQNSNVGFGFQGNLNSNLGNIAGQAIHNTYGFLNKTFQNLNQLSMGNLGNILPTRPSHQRTTLRPDIHNGGITQVPNHSSISTTNGLKPQPTAPIFQGDDNNISHYIDGKFPVILLKPEDVRK